VHWRVVFTQGALQPLVFVCLYSGIFIAKIFCHHLFSHFCTYSVRLPIFMFFHFFEISFILWTWQCKGHANVNSFTAIFVTGLLANVMLLLFRMNRCRSSHKCHCIDYWGTSTFFHHLQNWCVDELQIFHNPCFVCGFYQIMFVEPCPCDRIVHLDF